MMFLRSIKAQLILIAIIAALPLIYILFDLGLKLRENTNIDAMNEIQVLVAKIAAEEQVETNQIKSILSDLARLPEVKNQDKAKTVSQLKNVFVQNPKLYSLFVADTEGNVWASAVSGVVSNLSNRKYFINAMTNGSFSSGEYVQSYSSSRPIIHFSSPVINQAGKTIGVIGTSITVDRLRQLAESVRLPGGSKVVICDHRGVILHSTVDPDSKIGTQYPLSEFSRIQAAQDMATVVENGVVVSQRKVRLEGEQDPYLYIIGSMPLDPALSEAGYALMEKFVLLLCGLGLSITAAMYVAKRYITAPVNILLEASNKLASGDFNVNTAALVGKNEFSHLGITFDMMARRLYEREQALIASQERLNNVVSNAPVILFALDKNGIFILSEGKGLAVLGLLPGQVVGQSAFDLYKESPSVLEGLRRAMAGESFETIVESAGVFFETWYCPLLDDSGEFTGTIGVSTDITESRQLQAQLVQAQKLESIGLMAGGVAHDFNNFLTPIMSYAQLLTLSLSSESREFQMAKSILMTSEKARLLIKQLLSLGRKDNLVMNMVDLGEVVTSLHEILRKSVRADIELQYDLSQQKQFLKADRSHLEQIVMNLVLNAQDAIAQCGVISVGIKKIALDKVLAIQQSVVKAGDYVLLSVSDNGSGMDEDTVARIYEPFFTTKEVGSGTGLGLATVYVLVKEYGGSIIVDSKIGSGSTFKIYFPIAESKLSDYDV
jgi:two-component system, cell cycle sensor histidine kinase and response regulator CckA